MLRLNQKVLESINSLRGVKSKKYEFFVCITTFTFTFSTSISKPNTDTIYYEMAKEENNLEELG
jgi:hypothetical protein